MCKYCEFKENERGLTGEVWREHDDAEEVCGEMCIMKHGGYWLCEPIDYTEDDGQKRVWVLVVRISFCPMCGRDLRNVGEIEHLRNLIKQLDASGYKTLKELVSQ